MSDESIFNLPDAAVGPITAAIVAGAIALVSFVIAKEQKTSEFRQAWIDELRKDIATFISSINALRDIDRIDLRGKDHWDVAGPVFQGSNEALARIKLRLNPSEPPSKEILYTMEAMERQFCFGVEPDPIKLTALENKLLTQSQRVLKTEWDRVRRGEPGFFWTKWIVVSFVLVAMVGILRRINLP